LLVDDPAGHSGACRQQHRQRGSQHPPQWFGETTCHSESSFLKFETKYYQDFMDDLAVPHSFMRHEIDPGRW
jgi:hypothetical protein